MKVLKEPEFPIHTEQYTCSLCQAVLEVEVQDLQYEEYTDGDYRGDTWKATRAVFNCPCCNSKMLPSKEHNAAFAKWNKLPDELKSKLLSGKQ